MQIERLLALGLDDLRVRGAVGQQFSLVAPVSGLVIAGVQIERLLALGLDDLLFSLVLQ